MPDLFVDPVRRRVRLSPAALAAGVLLVPGPLTSEPLSEAVRQEVAELEALDLVVDGELVPWVAQILMLMLAPALHVEAVVANRAGEAMTQVWARPGAAILGQIEAGGWVDLAPTEPGLLAWTLADAVGLSAASAAATTTTTTTTTSRRLDDEGQPSRRPIEGSRLAAFEQALTRGDHREAEAVVGNGHDLSEDELAVMAALAAPERRAWRINAAWSSPDGAMERSLSVIDAGAAGLWCTTAPPQGIAAGASARAVPGLVPVSVAETWHALLALLPPGTSASPDDHPAQPGRAPCPTPVQPIPTASCASP